MATTAEPSVNVEGDWFFHAQKAELTRENRFSEISNSLF
jgi:hypothetical protein